MRTELSEVTAVKDVTQEHNFPPAHSDDYDFIRMSTAITNLFFDAVRGHVEANPQLQNVMKRKEFNSVSLTPLLKAISEEKCKGVAIFMDGYGGHFDEDLFLRHEAESALIEGRAYDKYIGAVNPFLSSAMVASFMPPAADAMLAPYAKMAEKYGMPNIAKAALFNLGLKIG